MITVLVQRAEDDRHELLARQFELVHPLRHQPHRAGAAHATEVEEHGIQVTVGHHRTLPVGS